MRIFGLFLFVVIGVVIYFYSHYQKKKSLNSLAYKNIITYKEDFSLPESIIKNLSSPLTEKQPTLISYWSILCEPCFLELKKLNDLQQSGYPINIIAVNTDLKKEDQAAAQIVWERKSLRFKTLFRNDLDNTPFIQNPNLPQLPFHLIFNKKNKLSYEVKGSVEWNSKPIINLLDHL